jgi:hypothetical protein
MPYAPPAMPAYTEQKVTAYKAVVKTREVKRDVMRMVTKDIQEPYTYWECVATTTPEKRVDTIHKLVTKEVPVSYTVSVPVVTQEKRKVTVMTNVSKEVPFTHTVCVPVVTQEKRKVTVMTNVSKEVPYTYTACVPVVTRQKVKQTVMTCVQEEVVRQIPVCRMASVQCVDPCTGCVYTVCRPVTEMQTIKGMVSRWVPTEREVEADVTTWKHEERKGTRLVWECVPQEREVLVNVCTWQQQERKGTRLVCETVPEKREYTVNVVRYQNVEKKGTRTRRVCEWVKETVPVTETYTEWVAYETTVQVPTFAPGCYVSYGAPDCGRSRGGLFGRLCRR